MFAFFLPLQSATSVITFSTILMASVAFGEDSAPNDNWGNFRGPNFTGVSSTAKPPIEWSANKNVAWKTEIPGRGSSSPVVWGEMIFLSSAVNNEQNRKAPTERLGRRELFRKFDKNGDGQLNEEERNEARKFRRQQQAASLTEHSFVVMCVDRASGKILWQHEAIKRKPKEGHHRDGSYASASPVTDGKHVYFNFGSSGLYCYSLDGKQVWKRTDLGEMQMRGSFGEGSSIALSENKLILPWDHEGQSKILALNKATGETIWEQKRDEPSNWATPVVADIAGKKQIIQSGENYSRGYDLENGKELWRSSGLSSRPVSTPVVVGNVGIFSSARGNYRLNAYALDRTGDISSEPIWKINEKSPDCPSLLLSGERLFYTAGNLGVVSCANANDGALIFDAQRLSGIKGMYSSPVAADGKVFLTGRSGKTVVIADSNEFKLLATNDIGEPVDATLALVGNQIFIRGNRHLFCIQESATE